MNSPSPSAVYSERMAARRGEADRYRARLDRLGLARLGVFLVGLGVLVAALGGHASAYLLAGPVLAFVPLAVGYDLTRKRVAWYDRAAAFYAAGLARLDGKPGGGNDGARFADENHPYAADLDLFGPGSLFERLTCARTAGGEETLAAWLKAPAPPAEVAARQAAVADLAPRLDLREALALAGGALPPADYASLIAWGAAGGDPVPAWKRRAVELVGWGNVFAWIGWLFVGTTAVPVIVVGILSIILAGPLLGWSRRVLAPVGRAERELSLLESVLAILEREPFADGRLRDLRAAMTADGLPASAQVRQLREIIAWLDARRNALFIPVAVLRLWDVRLAFKAEAWRARSGPAVRRWLQAVAEAEALSSLAGFAYENPADVFPTVAPGPPRFEAAALGHPLLPGGGVRNDVRLGPGLRLLVVSGSNMSGKSTLLRAVGVNAVLAQAGGVVRAGSLTLSPLAVGATVRVQDSLRAGRSRFFAEVVKVRALLDLAAANAPPLLFLLDELFAGTNSADRLAGADGVLRALLDAGAVGLVSTHDLALTGVADRLAGAANVHFRDGEAGGELTFDYTMRPGVVPRGNGLALMRAVGLRV